MGGDRLTGPLQEASVRVVLELVGLERELDDRVQAAAQRVGRNFDRALRQRVAETGRAAGRELGQQLGQSAEAAGERTGRTFATGLLGRVQRAGADARAAMRDSLSRFEGDARAAGQRSGRAFADAFGTAVKGLAIGALITGVLGGAAAGIGGLTNLVAALAPLVGIVQALPAAFAVAAAGAVTLKVAFSGMGEAFKEALAQDPTKFEKALTDLAPTAREVAREFYGLVPALMDVRRATQGAFFEPLVGRLREMGGILRGPVEDGLVATASAAGRLARTLIDVVASGRGADTIRAVFGTTAGVIDRIAPSVGRVTSGILDFVRATLPAMDRIGDAVARVTDRFAAWLTRQAESGQALAGVNRALDTFTMLGRIIGNVGGIFSEVFRAVRTSTGDYLANINAALVRTREFLASGEGQTALGQVFRGLATLAKAVAPAFRALVVSIGQVVDVAGRLALALSSGTVALIRSLGNAVRNAGPGLIDFARGLSDVAERAAPAVESVGSALGDLLAAAVPLLPLLSGAATVVRVLADAFTGLPVPIQTAIVALLALRAVGAFNFIGQLTVAARDQTSVIGRMAESYRTTTGQLSEFARQQQFLATSVGPLGNALANAQGALTRFGGAAAGVGSAIATGIGGAARGLVGFLGGPWGVALAAAAVGLSFLASSNATAAQAAQRHQAQVASLADTLNRQTGAVTGATRQLLADQAAREGWLGVANRMGISSQTFLDALTGQGTAMASVERQLASLYRTQIESTGEWRRASSTADDYGITLDLLARAAAGNESAQDELSRANVRAGGSFNELISKTGNLSEDQRKLATALFGTGNALSQAQRDAQAAAAAMDPAAASAQKFADATGVLANNAADANTQSRALTDALNILNGGALNADQAQARFQETLANVASQMAAAKARTEEFGVATVNAAGQLDITNLAGRTLVETAVSLQQGLADSATKTLELGRANGDTAGALEQVAANAVAARQAFIDAAVAAGLNAEQAADLADKYGLIPSEVLITVGAPGATETERQLIDVYLQTQALPPNTDVRVTGLTADAIAKLRETGHTVNEIPGTKDVTVRANTADATTALRSFINSFSGTVIDIAARISNSVVGGGAIGGIQPMMAGGITTTSSGTMSAGTAVIVPPRTFRMIGDRQVGDEAFIPLVDTARSHATLGVAADRMGYDLVPKGGDGGTSVVFADGAIRVTAPYASPLLVAREVLNSAARELVTAGV